MAKRYLLAADFHGNIEAYKALKRAADAIRPDEIVLLGDLCSYGGDIEVNNELDKIFFPILAVRGNCDDGGTFDRLHAGLRGDGFFEENGARRVYFTHGHRYGRIALPPVLGKGDVLFYGHFHVPEIAVLKGVTAVCVGSMGRPRGNSEACFCTFDGEVIAFYAAETGQKFREYRLEGE